MTRKGLVDIPELLRCMAKQRPLFHSEADMQHELAWRIRDSHENLNVRLEYPFERLSNKATPPRGSSNKAVDIWLQDRSSKREMALELKYPTAFLSCKVYGEKFELKDQRAQDTRRYDVLKDVMRMEEFLDSEESRFTRSAAVLLLTNDSTYWKKRQQKGQNDAAFELHKDRCIPKDPLEWRLGTREGTKGKKRIDPIELRGAYTMKWEEYPGRWEVGPGEENRKKNRLFCFLHIPVRLD